MMLFGAVLAAGLRVRERVADHWTDDPPDSYAYMGPAAELLSHHRYVLRPSRWCPALPHGPAPATCRLPGYPLFLAAVVHSPVREYTDFYEPVKRVQRILDLLTGVLAFWLARRLAGWLAGWLALLCCTFYPFLIWYSAAILSEILSTFLTTLTLVLLVCAVDQRTPHRRANRCLLGAALLLGLGAIIRIDALTLLPGLALPLLLRRDQPLRQRFGALSLALLIIGLIISAWPLRNRVRVGPRYLALLPICDICGERVERTWFLRWLATWVIHERDLGIGSCLFMPECKASVGLYPAWAFDSAAEKKAVEQVLTLRNQEGLTPQVDEGFRRLALARIRAHPLRTFVLLPLKRAYFQWLSHRVPPYVLTRAPGPWTKRVIERHLMPIMIAIDLMGLAGLCALLALPGLRQARRAGLLALLALASRTGFFASIGHTGTRYLIELMPLAFVLCGVALAQVTRLHRPCGSKR